MQYRMTFALPFASPSLHDAPAVRHVVHSVQAQQSDLAFANIYLLRHKYDTEIAVENGFLFRYFGGQGRLQGYAFPRGIGDPSSALRRVEEDAALRGRTLRFCLLTEEQMRLLDVLYPGRFSFHADAGDADYLYKRDELAELPGARFHRKRNHLARFRRDYPVWRLLPLTPDCASDALAVASGWLAGASSPSPALFHEYEAISHALELMEPLALFGMVLYVGTAPVGMAVGSMISPCVADIHYEKCLPAFRSAYPLLNQGLAAQLRCKLINREEDLNDAGLRQAKLSYFPALILSKFNALPC